MSKSDYSRQHFNKQRTILNIGRGLEAIGDTRFSTIYWSADSVLRGLPALRAIVRDPNLGIEISVCRDCILNECTNSYLQQTLNRLFEDTPDTLMFEIELTKLTSALRPFA
jgi:hypothetical protein